MATTEMKNSDMAFNKILLLLLLALLFASPSPATVTKTPAKAAFLNLAFSIRDYKDRQGSFPASWKELISSGSVSDELLADLRKYCDAENRYQFFPSDRQVEIRDGEERIIMLAKYPGFEGDDLGPDGVTVVPGRLLIVETKTGDIETRAYREEKLNNYFKLAKRSLPDYTENAPDISKDASRSDSKNPDLGGSSLRGDFESPRYKATATSPKVPAVPKHRSAPWLIVTGFGLLILMVLLILKLRGRRKKSQL